MAQIVTKFITNNAVTNAKLAQMPADTIKGNNTGSTANAMDLTVSQAQTLLSIPTSSSPLALNAGGTGTSAASANAAFAALSPLTTAGDIIYENSTPLPVRLGIGTTGQVLTVVAGLPAWSSPATSGTVTSVALADGSTTPIYAISGSPVTSSGTLTLTLDTQSANTVFAGPTTGSAAQPTFRALVAADIPTISLTTGVSGILPIANGGTNASSAAAAFNNISPLTTTGDMIYEVSTGVAGRLAVGTTGQVLGVSAGAPAWVSPSTFGATATTQNITLASGDITNQYVDLAQAVEGTSASSNSVSLSVVGGPIQQKTVDYTVSLTGGAGGVTRITFAGDLASGGNAALVSGDILMVSYSY